MRSYLLLIFWLVTLFSFAQTTEPAIKKAKLDYSKLDLKNRANDHFLIQMGYDGWAGTPDSIQVKGFGRHLNVSVMLDKPMKSNPQWSTAFGLGVGSSNIFFNKTLVDIVPNSGQTQATFTNVANAQYFKKYKLANVYVEIPVELRWALNPAEPNRSFKVAVGGKVGSMFSATTKGKNLLNSAGGSVHGNRYILKEKERSYFNTTRLMATMRLSYGPVGLYGAYQITSLFKQAQGPDVRQYSIGLSISGL